MIHEEIATDILLFWLELHFCVRQILGFFWQALSFIPFMIALVFLAIARAQGRVGKNDVFAISDFFLFGPLILNATVRVEKAFPVATFGRHRLGNEPNEYSRAEGRAPRRSWHSQLPDLPRATFDPRRSVRDIRRQERVCGRGSTVPCG